jgi:hypothetical protein
MDDNIQREYRQRLTAVLELKAGRRAKIMMLEALANEMRGITELNRGH